MLKAFTEIRWMVFFNFNDFEKQVYRPIFLKIYVKKSVIIGIVVSGIIIGIFASLSFGSFSMFEDEKEPILEEDESKPQGRNLSIELDEKMGLSAP